MTDGRQAGREGAFSERSAVVERLAGNHGRRLGEDNLAERLAAIEHLHPDFVIGRRRVETIVETQLLIEIILAGLLFDERLREIQRAGCPLRFGSAEVTATHRADHLNILAVDRPHHLERRRIFAFRFFDQRLELTGFLRGDHLLCEGKGRNRGKRSDHAAAKKCRNLHRVLSIECLMMKHLAYLSTTGEKVRSDAGK